MIPDVLTFPIDPDQCSVTNCDMVDSPVSACRKRGCGFEWARASVEGRWERDAKDAEEKRNA